VWEAPSIRGNQGTTNSYMGELSVGDIGTNTQHRWIIEITSVSWDAVGDIR